MDFDSLFAGISPGGMTDGYEIKILICYLLDALKQPITKAQMDEVLQGNRFVNYFCYSGAYQELLKSGHISLEEKDGEDWLILNQFGKDTAHNLQSSLPLSVREKVVTAGMDIIARMKRDRERETRIEPSKNGYTVHLRLHDGEVDLLRLAVFAPDQAQAELIRDRLSDHTAEIYQGMISLIIQDPDELATLAETMRKEKESK